MTWQLEVHQRININLKKRAEKLLNILSKRRYQKMRLKKLVIIIVVFFVLMGLPYITDGRLGAAEIKLSAASLWPAIHPNYKSLVDGWGSEIEKRTKSTVKVVGYPVGTLLTAKEIYEGVLRGIADIGISALAYTRGRFPLMEAIDLPMGYGTADVATKVANDLYRKYKPKELMDTHVCFLHAHGPGILATKKPVRKLEDLKGMRIRCTGLAAKVISKLGGVPVAMDQAQAYEALQKGVVDGTACPIEVLEEWKQGEHIKYVTLNYSSAYTTTFFTVMNLNKWNSLPRDIQGIISDINDEWIKKQAKLWDDLDKQSFPWLKEKGVEIIVQPPDESSRWEQAVLPLIDEFIVNKGRMGLPAKDVITDIKILIKQYSK